MTQPKPKWSFRGVGMHVVSHSTVVGRRQDTHGLPFQDKGARHVDIGRAPTVIEITVLVAGEAYPSGRDALIDAFQEPGAGLLTGHPKFGRLLVTVGKTPRIVESTEAGGTCTITFTATEDAEKPQSSPSLDTGGNLKSLAKKGLELSKTSFENPVTGLKGAVSDFVAAAHLDVLDEVLSDIRKVNAAIASALSVPGAFAAQLDAISRELANLLDTPGRLFDAFAGALELIGQATHRLLGPDGEDVESDELTTSSAPLRRVKGSYGSFYGAIGPVATLGSALPAVPDIDTEERRDQTAGQLAITRHFRGAGLLSFAAASVDHRYDSAADARAVRDALSQALSDLADSEPDMDAGLANAFRDTAAAVIAHLTAVAGTLAEVVTYYPPDTLPAEVIAYTLYGDAERAEEIVARNPAVRHPGMVQGKVGLEIRSE